MRGWTFKNIWTLLDKLPDSKCVGCNLDSSINCFSFISSFWQHESRIHFTNKHIRRNVITKCFAEFVNSLLSKVWAILLDFLLKYYSFVDFFSSAIIQSNWHALYCVTINLTTKCHSKKSIYKISLCNTNTYIQLLRLSDIFLNAQNMNKVEGKPFFFLSQTQIYFSLNRFACELNAKCAK